MKILHTVPALLASIAIPGVAWAKGGGTPEMPGSVMPLFVAGVTVLAFVIRAQMKKSSAKKSSPEKSS